MLKGYELKHERIKRFYTEEAITGAVTLPILREYISEALEREEKLRTKGIVQGSEKEKAGTT